MSTIGKPGWWLYLYLEIHIFPSIHLHLEREMFIIFSLQVFRRFDFFFQMRSWGGGKGSTHLYIIYEACPDTSTLSLLWSTGPCRHFHVSIYPLTSCTNSFPCIETRLSSGTFVYFIFVLSPTTQQGWNKRLLNTSRKDATNLWV